MFADFQAVANKVDLLLYELALLEQEGPSFEIVHRYQIEVDGSRCQPGEEVSHVVLVFRGRFIVVPLPLALLLLFDFLARHRHFPQSASQIMRAMHSSDFYRKHGQNAGLLSVRRFSRSAIKEYIMRIRKALARAFEEAGLPLDARKVLLSQTSNGTGVFYRLKAAVTWRHLDDIQLSDADTAVSITVLARSVPKGRITEGN